MIAFVQPYGLNSPGGGARILRSLLQEAPGAALSVCASPERPPDTRIVPEFHVPVRPRFGRIESTRLGGKLGSLGPFFAGQFRRRLSHVLRGQRVTVIHAIPHGIDFWYTFQVATRLGLPYYLSIHDDFDYTLRGRPERQIAKNALACVWRQAQGRFVISSEMGEEYSHRYGHLPYEVITDGLSSIAGEPKRRPDGRLQIYFAGAKHLSYEANFQSLFKALGTLHGGAARLDTKLICRGSSVNAHGTSVPVSVLPWASDGEVERDLDQADWLYLPLPFEAKYEAFYRFSLSTKMVTYLGSGIPILYHGPRNAAASRLLAEHGAAVIVDSLDPRVMAESILAAQGDRWGIACRALTLARGRFWLPDLRQRFWHAPMGGSLATAGNGRCGHSARVAA